jgi:hypothetical protein
VTPIKSVQTGLIPKECRIGELQHVWATWERQKKRIEQFRHKKRKKAKKLLGADAFQVRFVRSGRDIRKGSGVPQILCMRDGVWHVGMIPSRFRVFVFVLTVQLRLGKRLSAWRYPDSRFSYIDGFPKEAYVGS